MIDPGPKLFIFADPSRLASALADGPMPALPVRAIVKQRHTPVHISSAP